MRTLTINYSVYDQHDVKRFENSYRASFSGELAPQILRAGINMINSEAKEIGYYTISDIFMDDVPKSDTFRDDRVNPWPVENTEELQGRHVPHSELPPDDTSNQY